MTKLNKNSDWRIGGQEFAELKKTPNIFSRLTLNNANIIDNKEYFLTNITIDCIDKTEQPLNFYYIQEPFYGKESDRSKATLISTVALDNDLQLKIIERANILINNYRSTCYNLCFTNYRDRNRKRIGFKEAYMFASLAYKQIIEQ